MASSSNAHCIHRISIMDRLKRYVTTLGDFLLALALLFKRQGSIQRGPPPRTLPPSPSTAKSSSSPAHSPPDWRHDVFVSFRGEDTRKGFASHLFHALNQADIRCYRDIERQERGQVVGPMLIKAIHDSRIAIIIFSTNYADSKWCLREVVEILKCNNMYKEHGHMVIPIFYDVEPSEVRRQSGKFGEGFRRCQPRDEEEKQAWMAALEEAGNISSWNLETDARDEAEFIEQIVQDLSNRVFYFHSPYYTNNAVGLDHNIDNIISLLNIESDDVRVMGIHGMEGVGKTTMAKVICSRLYNKFQGVSLLEDIQYADEESKLVKLQRQLLQNVLKIRNVMFFSDQRNTNIGLIRDRLYRKKILLVLDGLDKKQQAFSIIGEHDFLGPGSRILITTRNEQLLDDLGVDEKFIVFGLNPQDSLQLFYYHAFAQGSPREGYKELSENLVHYAGGIPLAIKTFASFLSEKMKDEWDQILMKLVKSPHLDSLGVYLRSVSPHYPFKPVGPFGGTGKLYDDSAHSYVRKILVIVSEVIQSIIIEYDHDGSLVRSSVHGGLYAPNKGRGYQVTLDCPDEFLISISGYIAENYGFRVIRSLRFLSNKRLYGPFGEETGTSFTFPAVENGMIVGFFGNCDTYFVDSIGAYFGPILHPYPFNSSGPTNVDGETWDDKKHMDIRQIDVMSSSAIESISVLYDNFGHPLGPFTHGRVDQSEKHTVKLDYPYEYLTSISGYLGEVSGRVRVRSLTFHSNKRKFGPFGPEVGMHFPAQWKGGKIVGFFGTVEDSHLASIRAHFEPVSHIHPFKEAGPFGGEHGHLWDDGRHNNLRQIVITWERAVCSIECVHEIDGIIVEGAKHGGSGRSNKSMIELDFPNEYVGMMSGYYGTVDGVVGVTSLTFQSNFRTYGPFGRESQSNHTYFKTPWNNGMISGFCGRSGSVLNAIGAHFSPIYHKLPLKVIGPFGNEGMDQWDDGRYSGIRRINIWSGQIVDGINCVYDNDGDAVEGPKHGGGNSRPPHVIELDYPNEYLKSISGHTGQLVTDMWIRSLTFRTNRNRFGPYGSEDGTPFSFESNDGKIVGFFGHASVYLHSIGAHIEVLSEERAASD